MTIDNKYLDCSDSNDRCSAVQSQGMMTKNHVHHPDAGAMTTWHIPRPSLISSSDISVRDECNDLSAASTHSSNNSTQSVRSGSLLLTAANLAKINKENNRSSQHVVNLQYYLDQQQIVDGAAPTAEKRDVHGLRPPPTDDAVSIASSTHFTVVNGARQRVCKKRSCCHKHKLTALVVTMSTLFMLGIIVAVYLFEMRAMHIRSSPSS